MAMTSATAASVAAYAAIASAVTSTAAAAYTTSVNYENAKAEKKMAQYNQRVAEQGIRSANIEKSMAIENTRAKALRSIAAGRAAMTAAGNVGPTADTSVFSSFLDLNKDISAIEYNYGSRAAAAENQAQIYGMQSDVYGANAVNALVGGGLNTMATFAKGMYGVGNAEGWWTPANNSAVDPMQYASANNLLK